MRSAFPHVGGRLAGLAVLGAAALTSGCAGPHVGRTLDARAPRAAETTVTDVRTFGPFYERVETSAGDSRVSLRPCLYTRIDAPSDDAHVHEVFWPLYADHSRHEHFSWRFLLAFGADFDTTVPNSRNYTWILPFWFHGRTADGVAYRALFPVGGSIHDFLTYDRLRFVLFPLYLDTTKGDIRGQHLLWPIFARVTGDDLSRWRIFPLYGHGRKDGEWERWFVLWPIWSYARYDRAPTAGYEWALVPIFGRSDRSVESSWSVLPPFFQFLHGRGKNEGQRRILCPWPFVRIEDSKNYHKRHYWPFYAVSWTEKTRNTHILWPFYRYTTATDGRQTHTEWSLAPLFHRAEVRPVVKDGATPVAPTLSYLRFWPFYSRIEREARSVVRVPDFSIVRRTGPLERNLLHMFTLYTRGEDATSGRVERDLLWGLAHSVTGTDGYRERRLWPFYRGQRDPATARDQWSLLGGLLGRDDDDGVVRRRFLWFFTHAAERRVPEVP